jgi:hypothetical protein
VACIKKLYFLSVGFLQEAGPRFLPSSWRIGAGSGTRVRLRSSSSQCRFRWSGLLPAGPTTATRSSYADARFVNRMRLLVMVDGANRRTMSITIGSGFAVAAVSVAEGRSPFCRCSLFPTRITACWRAVRHCCVALWSTARGRRRRRSSKMLTAYRIPRLCAAGRKVWTSHGRPCLFSARRLREWPGGWNPCTRMRTEQRSYPG